MRRKVDFPQPDGPISAVTVAGGTDMVTSSSTLVSPNQAETSTASRLDRRRQGDDDGFVRGRGHDRAPARAMPMIPWPTIGAFSCVPPAEPKKGHRRR